MNNERIKEATDCTTLSLRVTERQLRTLVSTLEMEYDRSTAQQGSASRVFAPARLALWRVDLLDILRQLPNPACALQ
jgi:hypothetical protein